MCDGINCSHNEHQMLGSTRSVKQIGENEYLVTTTGTKLDSKPTHKIVNLERTPNADGFERSPGKYDKLVKAVYNPIGYQMDNIRDSYNEIKADGGFKAHTKKIEEEFKEDPLGTLAKQCKKMTTANPYMAYASPLSFID